MKLSVHDVTVGMYVEKLEGSWLASPFWQKQLMLETPADVNKLRGSAIREVWVNLAKSRLQPAAEAACPAEPAVPEVAEPAAAEPVRSAPPPLGAIAPVSMADELQQATVLLNKSREAVQSMFAEARMGKAVTVDAAMPLVQEIAESVMRNSGAMIGLARLKTADDYTYMHSVAVAALMIALGKELQLDDDQIRLAGMAGLLHDIGKMAVPLAILNKPGKLNDDEFASVKNHPREGYQILSATPGMPEAALDVCLHHHEKIDGSGYPEGLQGEQISVFARMGAICDVYDAITSNRPYKQGWCPAESLRKMAEWSKGHFDEQMFSAFVRCLGIYPVGTLVRLKSGGMGVVVEQSAARSLIKPKVRVFYSARTRSYLKPVLLDLGKPGVTDAIVGREEAAAWNLENVDRYWNGEVEFV